jgi:hypothetical protein
MMRYYLHIDPENLSDEQWTETFKQLAEIRKSEAQANH